jgi:hypothetical protein
MIQQILVENKRALTSDANKTHTHYSVAEDDTEHDWMYINPLKTKLV